MKEYYVKVENFSTGEVVTKMGPVSYHKAEKIKAGVDINLNHGKYICFVSCKDDDWKQVFFPVPPHQKK